VAKKFMLFGHGDGTSAPWDMGTTEIDICSNSCHPLFPQVEWLMFDDLAERGRAHTNNDYAHNRMTATTTRFGKTTNTKHMDESRLLFWSAQPPENPYNTSYRMGAMQFAPVAAGQAHQMENADGEEEEASLGGHIVSPQNADQQHQALAKKISPSDVV
jgi:hypothetical protein